MVDEKDVERSARAICIAAGYEPEQWADNEDLRNRCMKYARVALEALSPGSTGETEGWRDIKSDPPPMDGTVFFGTGPDDAYPQAMRWQAYSEDEAEEVGEPGYWAYCEDLIGDVTGSANPLHWRPMFAPPSAMLSAAGER